MSTNTIDLSLERIAWLDVESTGIDPHEGEKLLQVAAIVTDGELNELHEGYMAKIFYSAEEAKAMREASNSFVQAMHDKTNLWATLATEGAPLAAVEEALLSYLKTYIPTRCTARLGGNSITLDRNFLSFFMPKVLDHLHYRSYDMTSVRGFFDLYRPEIEPFEKKSTHDAFDDIRESLAEARYYKEKLQRGVYPLS